jgi:hypothetical protein
MQAIAHDSIQETSQNGQMTVSIEVLAVIALALLSILLRVIDLGATPLGDAEVERALSAWRATSPSASGSDIVADSPVIFWGQRLAFTFVGGSEGAARIFTAIGGVLLSLTPLLFRGLLGRVRAYLFSLLLTLSPVLLAASRFSSGVVWAMLFGVLGLWAIWQYWEDDVQRDTFSVLGTIFFGSLIFLSEPGGPVLAIILIGACAIALSLSAMDAPDEVDAPGDDFLSDVRTQFTQWNWRRGLLFTALIIVAISSGFFLYPGGLSMVGAMLDGFLSGVTQSKPDAPLFFPLVTSLFYETWLWGFAIAAIWVILRRDEMTYVERFLIVWVVLATIASMIFAGAEAGHALWLIVPLAGLASYLFTDVLADDGAPAMWIADWLDDEDLRDSSARWGKWLLAGLTVALMIMLSIHFQLIVRDILGVPGGSLTEFISRFDDPGFDRVVKSVIWFFITLLLFIVGYFLAASIWENRTTGRGITLGLLIFAIATSFGSGWNLIFENSDDATELWQVTATHKDVQLLRKTMLELSFRETGGVPAIPATVIGKDSDIIAWELRDFPYITYTSEIADARTNEIVIIPETEMQVSNAPDPVSLPDLGGSYVGQSFNILMGWDIGSLAGFDVLPWWSTHKTRFDAYPTESVILWVRQDIFDSNPFELISP